MYTSLCTTCTYYWKHKKKKLHFNSNLKLITQPVTPISIPLTNIYYFRSDLAHSKQIWKGKAHKHTLSKRLQACSNCNTCIQASDLALMLVERTSNVIRVGSGERERGGWFNVLSSSNAFGGCRHRCGKSGVCIELNDNMYLNDCVSAAD